MARSFDYLRDPRAIYERSFSLVEAMAPIDSLPKSLRNVAIRIVHACAMPNVVQALRWEGEVSSAAARALAKGAPVIVDAEMVGAGITRKLLPADNRIVCTLNHPAVETLARRRETTRSAAAVELWVDHIEGAVVAIGNAPTALFRLLELLVENDMPKPAALLAFPVGFVGASESKSLLIELDIQVPYLTLAGRQGGSAIAAAAVNALAIASKPTPADS